MRYFDRSLTDLFRGPILHTPQGLTLLVTSSAYWLYAICIVFLDIATPFNWSAEFAIILFMAWPLILFLFFVKESAPSFLPSWKKAIWIFVYASLPFVFSIEF